MNHPVNCSCPAPVCQFRRTRGVTVVPAGVRSVYFGGNAGRDQFQDEAHRDAEAERLTRDHLYDAEVRYGSC